MKIPFSTQTENITASSGLSVNSEEPIVRIIKETLTNQRLSQENRSVYNEFIGNFSVPKIYFSHLAWQDVKFTRKNSLVIDPYKKVNNIYYFRFNSDTEKSIGYYRNCHDPGELKREPLPDLDYIIYVDYKLYTDSNSDQRRMLNAWLHSNSPLKLLHISIDQYDCTNSLGLLESLSDITWTTNLSIQIIDKTVHRQNDSYVRNIANLFRPVSNDLLTIELHSSPSNNLSGTSYLWDLKDIKNPVSTYNIVNINYINFLDALRSGRITQSHIDLKSP